MFNISHQTDMSIPRPSAFRFAACNASFFNAFKEAVGDIGLTKILLERDVLGIMKGSDKKHQIYLWWETWWKKLERKRKLFQACDLNCEAH